MIGVVASRFDKTSKSTESKALSSQDRRAAGVSPLYIAGLDSESCETLGFRHLQLAAQGIKLRSASHGLRYNNYKYFYLIYRQAGKKMIMISYFSIALIVFLVWFKSFWNDTATSKNDLISWIALVIGPLVWPVVLPLSILQITSKKSVVQTAQCEQEF